jgi:hypothetical protein
MAKTRYIPISRAKAIEFLQEIKGASFITIQMASEPAFKGKKADNPYVGRVQKIQTLNGILNYDYEINVNNARLADGKPADFVASKSAWGTRVGDTCIIEHTGKDGITNYYFDMRVLRSLKSRYTLDGKAVKKDVIRDWLKPSSPPTAGICVRRPKMANITHLRVKGAKYRLQ